VFPYWGASTHKGAAHGGARGTASYCIYVDQCFQPFSSRGTAQKFQIIWRNAPYSAIYSIFREPSKELPEPLGSAEPRLKNTDVDNTRH